MTSHGVFRVALSLPSVCLPAAPEAGLPSWDTPSLPPQAPQLHPSAPRPRFSLRDSAQSSWQKSKATAVPSWQNSSSSSMTAVSGQRDPFAGLSPPQTTHQGAADRTSDSLFGSLSAGKLFYQAYPAASHSPIHKPKIAAAVVIQTWSNKLGQTNLVIQTWS